ncbi:MAG: Rrf2 family transcriptional regulator [Candidatus Krumholzibacteria bacterium]|nr:Rrf2 family transcriptional regulator [Candidatus Krumholzibacteria bacterium]
MRLTAMFRYGLRALAVMSERYGKQPVSAKEISELEGISPSFLEQLLAHLRRHDIIVGVRGPGGGFRLKRPPEEIKISDIVEALEGSFYVASCLSGNCEGEKQNPCDKFEDCVVVPILKKLEEDISSVISSYNLSDIKTLYDKEKND